MLRRVRVRQTVARLYKYGRVYGGRRAYTKRENDDPIIRPWYGSKGALSELTRVLLRGCNPNFPKFAVAADQQSAGGPSEKFVQRPLPQLNKWLEHQRYLYSKNKLHPYGQYMLEKMGIDLDWQPQPPREKMFKYVTDLQENANVHGGWSVSDKISSGIKPSESWRITDSSVPYGWFNPSHYYRDPVWVHWWHSMPPVLKQIRMARVAKFADEKERFLSEKEKTELRTEDKGEDENNTHVKYFTLQDNITGDPKGETKFSYRYPLDLEEMAEELKSLQFRPPKWRKYTQEKWKGVSREKTRTPEPNEKQAAMIIRALKYEKIRPFQLTKEEIQLVLYQGLKCRRHPEKSLQYLIARLNTWLEWWKQTPESEKVQASLRRNIKTSPLRDILLDGLHRLDRERTQLKRLVDEKEEVSKELDSLSKMYDEKKRRLKRRSKDLDVECLRGELQDADETLKNAAIDQEWISLEEEVLPKIWQKLLDHQHARKRKKLKNMNTKLRLEENAMQWQKLAADHAIRPDDDDLQQREQELIKEESSESPSNTIYRGAECVPSWETLKQQILDERVELAKECRELKLDLERVEALIRHTSERNNFYTGANSSEILHWKSWKPVKKSTQELEVGEFQMIFSKDFSNDRDSEGLLLNNPEDWEIFDIPESFQWRRPYEHCAPAWYTECVNYHFPSKKRAVAIQPGEQGWDKIEYMDEKVPRFSMNKVNDIEHDYEQEVTSFLAGAKLTRDQARAPLSVVKATPENEHEDRIQAKAAVARD